MNIDSFIIHIQIKDVYTDIVDDVEKNVTLSYRIKRPLPKGKNKQVTGLMKDELLGKIMKKFAGLRPNTYS